MKAMQIHALLGFVVSSSFLFAQDDLPVRAPKEALLFKSGQSYLFREARLSGDEKKVRLRLPPGIHGTIWLESDSAKITSTRALNIDTTVETEVRSLVDCLQMAIGQAVVLDCTEGDKVRQWEGQLVRVFTGPSTAPRFSVAYQPVTPPTVVTTLVLDRGEGAGQGRHMVLPVSRVVGVALRQGPSKWSFQAPKKIPVLEAALSHVADGKPGRLGLSYMAEGLAWAPSYALDLGAAGKARLIGKAVVMNDLEDLEDTHVRLVVGYPNIKFAHVQSSLIPDVTIALFRGMLGSPSAPVSVMGQQIMSNIAMPVRRVRGANRGEPAEGEAVEDLYLYDLGRVTLRRGERAYRPFLDQAVGFAHRFDWKIDDRLDARGYYKRDEVKPNPVWHVLRLKNESGEPWTTAPILIRTDKGPLAQSQITYTPPGTEAVIRLTKALGIVAESVEYRMDAETSERRTTRLFGTTYEEIIVKCEMSVSNHGARDAPIRITKQLSGDIVEAGGEPKITGRAKSLGRVNASRTLRWEFELPVGESWKAEYRYRVLVRR